MQRHIITSIFLVLICGQIAQGKQAKPLPKPRGQYTAAIKVYPARGKRIRIVAGAERTLIDLTDDISGCLELFDPRTPKWRLKQSLGIKVIDRVRKKEVSTRTVGGIMTKTLLLLSLLLFSQDWPEFRGRTGQGHSDERGLPLTWSETGNVRWKVAIPGKGWSSPAIQGDHVWLTTATDEGKSLRAISVDRNTGAILKNVEVFRLKSLGQLNAKNSFASPTPVIEGDRVYLHFGAFGTACLTASGEIVWKTRLDYDNGQHGPGGSPVIYDDLLIVSCDGLNIQYVVALDKLTGKVRWRKYRQGYQAYTTPLVVRLPAGDQVISPGALRAIAYEPRTGKELWHVRYGEGFSNVPRPVYGHGLVYICSGFQEPSLLAVRLDGRGDVTKSHVAWTLKRGVSLTPSPLLVGEELYMVSDNGIASCVDAKTGAEHWRARLGGNHSASPIYADGRIYFLSEEGESVVIAPGKEFKALARNQLDGPTLASMAVSNGSIFVRSQTHLYRLSN